MQQFLLFCFAVTCTIASASADDLGNLAFASISWQQDTSTGPFAVVFTVKAIWNRNYANIKYCNGNQNASCLTSMTLLGGQGGTPKFSFLGTNRAAESPISFTVSQYSAADDPRQWVAGYFQMVQNYSGLGPWQVEFSGCCLAKNATQPFSLKSTVMLDATDSSPSIAVLPAVYSRSGQNISIPALNQNTRSAQNGYLSWSLVQMTPYAGDLSRILMWSDSGMISIPPGTTGAAYLTVVVTSGSASAVALFALEVSATVLAAMVQITPPPLSQSSAMDVSYTFYTGFAFQVQIMLPPMPAGGSVTVNSDRTACCPLNVPTHGFAGLSNFFVGGPEMSKLQMSFNVSASNPSPYFMVSWNKPCRGDVGSTVVCFNAMSAQNGYYTAQMCIHLTVLENVAPYFILPVQLDYVWMMGQTNSVDIQVMDAATQDTVVSLGVLGNTSLPQGALLANVELNGYQGSAQLQWTPAAGAGGGVYQICFGTADRKASPYDQCLVGQRSSNLCIVVSVVRCQYMARPRESLADIAYMFQTDWVQLWALNPSILEPDFGVGSQVAVINTGHLYMVETGDYLSAIAYKMGNTLSNLLLQNADLAANPQAPLQVGSMVCVIPNSCKREDP